MSGIVYEHLTKQHFTEWGVDFIPDDFVGFAERRDGALTGIGFVWITPERSWAMFDGRGHSAGIHKTSFKLFSAVAAGGVTEVYAGLDETKPNARKWLERLGFAETDEEGVWRIELGSGHFRRREGRAEPSVTGRSG